MGLWTAARQALTAMDLVMRSWGRSLRLDETSVSVLLLLMEEPVQSAARLARCSGRARQQVLRSLNRLHEKDIVEPAAWSKRDRIMAWRLTERGRTLGGIVDGAEREWEALIAEVLDTEALASSMRRLTRIIVNRSSSHGWRWCLNVPVELLKVPLRVQEKLHAELKEDGLVTPAPTPRTRTEEESDVVELFALLSRVAMGEADATEVAALDARLMGDEGAS